MPFGLDSEIAFKIFGAFGMGMGWTPVTVTGGNLGTYHFWMTEATRAT